MVGQICSTKSKTCSSSKEGRASVFLLFPLVLPHQEEASEQKHTNTQATTIDTTPSPVHTRKNLPVVFHGYTRGLKEQTPLRNAQGAEIQNFLKDSNSRDLTFFKAQGYEGEGVEERVGAGTGTRAGRSFPEIPFS